MSAKATFWTWMKKLSPTEKLVLLYLSDCANADDYAWPKYKTIMKFTGIKSKTTLKKALDSLEAKGMVKAKNRYRTKCGQILRASNLYYILADYPVSPEYELTKEDENSVSPKTGPMEGSNNEPIVSPENEPSIGPKNEPSIGSENGQQEPTNEPTSIKDSMSDASLGLDDSDSVDVFLHSKNGKLKWTANDMSAANFMLKHAEKASGREKPKRSHTLESFANEFRVFREQENLTLPQIFKPFRWALKAKDPFWRTTIRSPSGLRKHFDQLSARMLEDHNKNTTGDHGNGYSDEETVEQYLKSMQEQCSGGIDGDYFDAEFTEV